jgi:NAD(P)H-dependent flavin oxidoreductase YrpB (nitropropane dioxygenase family)
MIWDTAVTRLLGIRYPLLAGGLMWLADARYVAAVVRAGAMGFITARSFTPIERFEAELAHCAILCEGMPFGVNLTWSRRLDANDEVPRQLDAALAAGVRHFELVGTAPAWAFERIHAAGGWAVHKSGRVEHALKAESLGADVLALVGPEAGGHPGMGEVPGSLLAVHALERARCPIVLGGGIGTGRQIAASLALGCEAVLMGSRLLVCDEIGAHRNYKDRLLASSANDSVTVLRSTGHPWRVLDNATAREVRRLEATGVCDYPGFGPLVLGATGRDGAYRDGDTEAGMLSLGPAVAFADRAEPVAPLIERLMNDAATCLARAAQLTTGMPA